MIVFFHGNKKSIEMWSCNCWCNCWLRIKSTPENRVSCYISCLKCLSDDFLKRWRLNATKFHNKTHKNRIQFDHFERPMFGKNKIRKRKLRAHWQIHKLHFNIWTERTHALVQALSIRTFLSEKFNIDSPSECSIAKWIEVISMLPPSISCSLSFYLIPKLSNSWNNTRFSFQIPFKCSFLVSIQYIFTQKKWLFDISNGCQHLTNWSVMNWYKIHKISSKINLNFNIFAIKSGRVEWYCRLCLCIRFDHIINGKLPVT